ncbi:MULTISPECIES: nuclear transport factor 2 family protein [unclassified Acinetobacter]|uniref:nuclear transport factor 2 family protein n=1 Tax=unclassified Acinetobacter TaxID=196816 RepID=UPI001C55090B|nr:MULTISPECIES: nuclear transport factor 2 family protein [unclassified Acinetobacter]
MSMINSLQIIDQMFEAFRSQDLQAAVATVTEDTVWIHHGSQKLPSIRFEGKTGVEQFFNTNFTTMHVAYFDILRMVKEGNKVVVFGREKFTIDGQDGEFEQKWVQEYTIENGLISRMEEYATSVNDNDYLVVK